MKTRDKVRIARALSATLVRLRRVWKLGPEAEVRRHGVRWRLDLREGIDLALYLGVYERGSLKALPSLVRQGDTVLDIGANMGVYALLCARLVGPSGHVVAFEPTRFASEKLRRNVQLNPALAARITVVQAMLTSGEAELVPSALFSSWPLSDDADVHRDLMGRAMSTEGASAVRLDDYLASAGAKRVDFIKLDVDGHEYEVLEGARRLLEEEKPAILMEFCPYLHDTARRGFAELIRLLRSHEYRFLDPVSGRPAPEDPEALRALIPHGAGMNVLLRPS